MNRRGFLKLSATLAAVAAAPAVTAEVVAKVIPPIDDDYARFVAMIHSGEPVINDEFTFRRQVEIDVPCITRDCKFIFEGDGGFVITSNYCDMRGSHIQGDGSTTALTITGSNNHFGVSKYTEVAA